MNACGVDDIHDGVNYVRTACVIAVSKARDIFEPFMHQVCVSAFSCACVREGGGGCQRLHCFHWQNNTFPAGATAHSTLYSTPPATTLQLGYRLAHVLRRLLPVAMFLLQRDGQCLSGHDLFLKRVGAAYHAFIDEVSPRSSHQIRSSLSN